ncbi:MBL fold metallo-hydrolase [Gordonia desulfuricans]|uniref:MBL fold metallo-hydrolase n=1 Tax=Gordonia desulfuricans TaxID=89051 RepID=UPI000A672D89|nr:MBL fold metallo-hydrolase [Gordonia desulfuricans]
MSNQSFASSTDLADRSQTLEILADGVYALTADGDPNIGAIEGDDFVVCFEALATPVAAKQWLAMLREHTAKPVRYLVLSHYHAVRVLGAAAYDATAVIAHENTAALIEERGLEDWDSEFARFPRFAKGAETIPGLTRPTVTFADRLTIDLGPTRGPLVLEYVGRGHTEGDIVAWLPNQKILYTGDLIEAEAALYTRGRIPP